MKRRCEKFNVWLVLSCATVTQPSYSRADHFLLNVPERTGDLGSAIGIGPQSVDRVMDMDEASSSLDDIEEAMKELHLHANDTTQASQAVSVLADASKWNINTRQQLADPKVLRLLVDLIDCNLNDSLETVDVALRCIGNACIDNDAAREEITRIRFSWAIRCFQTGDSRDCLLPNLTTKVLYNICSDYEPAQQQCFREHVHYGLIQLCANSTASLGEDRTLLIELVIELLFWICSHKQPDSTTNDPLPTVVLTYLLSLPNLRGHTLHVDESAMLLETALLFLRDAQTQQQVIETQQLDQVWQMLTTNERKIAALQVLDSNDDAKLLAPLSASLIWCLSDIAASPEFGRSYNLNSQWMRENVIDTIRHMGLTAKANIANAACQILGNLLWPLKEPESFSHLVEGDKLHVPLLKLLVVDDDDADFLHATTGLLVQLSRASVEVRTLIGSDKSTRPALQNLCRHEKPELKQDGIKLLRALGKDCSANQERFKELAKEVMLAASFSDDVNMTEVQS